MERPPAGLPALVDLVDGNGVEPSAKLGLALLLRVQDELDSTGSVALLESFGKQLDRRGPSLLQSLGRHGYGEPPKNSTHNEALCRWSDETSL
jgi:hypothetical protein